MSNSIATQKIFSSMIDNDLSPEEIAKVNNWIQESDSDALQSFVQQALEKYPEKVAEYKKGKKGLIGLFMGEVMKLSRGKADPKIANQLVREALEKIIPVMIKNNLFLLSIVFLFSCSSKQGTIQGTINNAPENSWLFLEKLTLNDIRKVDSCQIKKDFFSFNYQPDSINFFRISLSEKNYGLIVLQKGDTIQFNAEAESLVNYKASGSEEVEANTLLLSVINSLKPKTDSLRIVYQKSIGTPEEEVVLERIRKKYDFIMSEHKKEISQFIYNKLNLFVNLIALQQLGDIANNIDIYSTVYQNLENQYPNKFWVKISKNKYLANKILL